MNRIRCLVSKRSDVDWGMSMIDTDLLVTALKKKGHEVGSVFAVPTNAGDYEFEVDGATLTLEEVRTLLMDETE